MSEIKAQVIAIIVDKLNVEWNLKSNSIFPFQMTKLKASKLLETLSHILRTTQNKSWIHIPKRCS